jgi:hypothetical protein
VRIIYLLRIGCICGLFPPLFFKGDNNVHFGPYCEQIFLLTCRVQYHPPILTNNWNALKLFVGSTQSSVL